MPIDKLGEKVLGEFGEDENNPEKIEEVSKEGTLSSLFDRVLGLIGEDKNNREKRKKVNEELNKGRSRFDCFWAKFGGGTENIEERKKRNGKE